MQTLAVSGEPPLAGGFASPRGEIAFTLLSLPALLPVFLDATLFIIVLRVVGTLLPVHLALLTADGPGIGSECGTEYFQPWGVLAWDDSNGGGAQVHPNGVAPDLVFGLVGGDTLQRQLHVDRKS